jgi:hypothetical protein
MIGLLGLCLGACTLDTGDDETDPEDIGEVEEPSMAMCPGGFVSSCLAYRCISTCYGSDGEVVGTSCTDRMRNSDGSITISSC